MNARKPRGAARTNLRRRSPAAVADVPPPPPRTARVAAAFRPRAVQKFAKAEVPKEGPTPQLVDTRHLRRLLQAILIETRTTRQYVSFLHEMLANHEMGKDADLPTQDTLKRRANARREDSKGKFKAFLEHRVKQGIGNGGMDLTPQEQSRIAAGEPIEDVLVGLV